MRYRTEMQNPRWIRLRVHYVAAVALVMIITYTSDHHAAEGCASFALLKGATSINTRTSLKKQRNRSHRLPLIMRNHPRQYTNYLYQPMRASETGEEMPHDGENYHHHHPTTRTRDTNTTTISILNAALLVAGTTIGGGFLALPAVVAPSGFLPSAWSLFAVWGYFLAESLIMVECLDRARHDRNQFPGVSSAARSALGNIGEGVISALLIVLTEVTLVSQISRAGIMFPSHYYRAGCTISALSISAIVFGTKQGIPFASRANSILTTLFLASAGALFSSGAGLAQWQRLSISSTWSAVPGAIPTFLQLLVYGEILPAVCELLQYQMNPIRSAIVLGSFLTLLLQIAWSALGLALLPTTASTAVVADPVNVLLATAGPAVRISLTSLAVTAILTTILGSYLALLSSFNDIVMDKGSKESKNPNSFRVRLGSASIITLPALAIACTSPSIFLNAIDFAGSYPVLLLWGVAPPVISLVQRHKERKDKTACNSRNSSGPAAWLVMLAVLSLGMVGVCAKQDVVWLVGKMKYTFQF